MDSQMIWIRISLVLTSFLFILISSTSAYSYPQNELDQCVQAAKSNSAVDGLPVKSLKSFCACALTAIVDEGKDEKASANQCAKENLNN